MRRKRRLSFSCRSSRSTRSNGGSYCSNEKAPPPEQAASGSGWTACTRWGELPVCHCVLWGCRFLGSKVTPALPGNRLVGAAQDGRASQARFGTAPGLHRGARDDPTNRMQQLFRSARSYPEPDRSSWCHRHDRRDRNPLSVSCSPPTTKGAR